MALLQEQNRLKEDPAFPKEEEEAFENETVIDKNIMLNDRFAVD